MSTYSHFTENKRYPLSALMKSGKVTLSEIAKIIGCHRITKMKCLPNRKTTLISDTSCALLAAFDVNSITFDNGKEFANHESMAKNKFVALHT